MDSAVFRPAELYRHCRNVSPDLIVHFGGLYRRSSGGLGYDSLYLQENDTGPDDCNHAQFGAFILKAPNVPVGGEVEGMRLQCRIPCKAKVCWSASALGQDRLPCLSNQLAPEVLCCTRIAFVFSSTAV